MTREEQIRETWRLSSGRFDFSKMPVWNAPLYPDWSKARNANVTQEPVDNTITFNSVRVYYVENGRQHRGFIIYCENVILHKPQWMDDARFNRIMTINANGHYVKRERLT